jgi:hypothetical protein
MTLTIKDLSTSTELGQAAMTAVRGGAQGNSAVSTIGQVQNVNVPVAAMSGPGSSLNNTVHVNADQHGSIHTYQNNGDRFSFLAAFPFLAL